MTLSGLNVTSSPNISLTALQCGCQWSVSTDQAIHLNGAHGSEIVRSLCLHYAVSQCSVCQITSAELKLDLMGALMYRLPQSRKVFTAGEDGLVKTWQMPVGEEEDELQSPE